MRMCKKRTGNEDDYEDNHYNQFCRLYISIETSVDLKSVAAIATYLGK